MGHAVPGERDKRESVLQERCDICQSEMVQGDVFKDDWSIEGLRVKGVRCLGDDRSAQLKRKSNGMGSRKGTRSENQKKIAWERQSLPSPSIHLVYHEH